MWSVVVIHNSFHSLYLSMSFACLLLKWDLTTSEEHTVYSPAEIYIDILEMSLNNDLYEFVHTVKIKLSWWSCVAFTFSCDGQAIFLAKVLAPTWSYTVGCLVKSITDVIVACP